MHHDHQRNDTRRHDFQPVPGDRLRAAWAMPRNPIPTVTPPTSIEPPPVDVPHVNPAPTTPPPTQQSTFDTLLDLVDYLHQQPNLSDQMKMRIIREAVQTLAPPTRMPGFSPLNDVTMGAAGGRATPFA